MDVNKALLELNKFKDFIPIGAFIFAQAAHAGQYRADNSSMYISHVFEVAKQLDDWFVTDDDHLTIALLHDVIEKTNATENILSTIFGKRITDEVMKISFDKNKMTEKEYFEQNKDNVVKLADHICNTRFFNKNKIKDPIKYYQKGLVVVNNFRDCSPFKETIEDLEKELNI